MGKLLVLAVLLGGCSLYFGHHNEDDVCLTGAPAGIGPLELRDPDTGICQTFDQFPCDGVCGPCAGGVLLPNWPACNGPCEGLDEASCLSTSACHAVFTADDPVPNGQGQPFLACWDTAPNGPVEGGSCVGLDALTCALHDDCSSAYATHQAADGTTTSTFEGCLVEPTSADPCATVDCAGQCVVECTVCDPNADSNCVPFCQAMCVPPPTCMPDSCAPGYTCVQECDALTNGLVGACTIACRPDTVCAALPTETACKGRADCEPVYKGTDCTCFPDHCECNTETYERCQAQQ